MPIESLILLLDQSFNLASPSLAGHLTNSNRYVPDSDPHKSLLSQGGRTGLEIRRREDETSESTGLAPIDAARHTHSISIKVLIKHKRRTLETPRGSSARYNFKVKTHKIHLIARGYSTQPQPSTYLSSGIASGCCAPPTDLRWCPKLRRS